MNTTRQLGITIVSAFFLGGLATFVGGCQGSGGHGTAAWQPKPKPIAQPVRGVWVARFHYKHPDDIRTIMANCAESGLDTVYWQVRGNATVAYPSKIEPWSREYDHRDPGFDPFALAVEEAHKHGLRIEAWVNVMPAWKGATPPPRDLDPPQVYHAHPEWFMYDPAGNRQALSEFYVILNPCLPEVRAHITSVVEEILQNYAVDGIHLDYIRFAWDRTPNAKQNYPGDPRSRALYRHETGKTPDQDPKAWDDWRGNQITKLVSDIRDTVDKRRPGASLTAAIWRTPELGYGNYLQNGAAWIRSGLLDAGAPMVYTTDTARFKSDIAAYHAAGCDPKRVIPGIGIYKHETPDPMAEQLAACQEWGAGFALFSYESLYPTDGDRKPGHPTSEVQRDRAMRRAVLERFVR